MRRIPDTMTGRNAANVPLSRRRFARESRRLFTRDPSVRARANLSLARRTCAPRQALPVFRPAACQERKDVHDASTAVLGTRRATVNRERRVASGERRLASKPRRYPNTKRRFANRKRALAGRKGARRTGQDAPPVRIDVWRTEKDELSERKGAFQEKP